MIAGRNSLARLTVLVLTACVFGGQYVLAENAPESPVARLQREGIRAMCNGEPEKLAAAGFNLTLPWERPLITSVMWVVGWTFEGW